MIRSSIKALCSITRVASMSTRKCRQLDKSLPEFQAMFHHDVVDICKAFLKNNYEIRIVGGAVRDMLMRRKPKDIDLSTTATPVEMIKIFSDNDIRCIETGLQHGTLTAHINEQNYEITTLRIDTETDGRKAVVHYTKDWYLDAQRRDLTVNAMSVDLNGVLYDYFNGEEDLKQKKIRFVGDAEYRIKEDFLRILRYFRFFGKIEAVTHEEDTLKIIKELAPGLSQISVERIWVEVSKILGGNNAPQLLELMYKLDVAENVGLPACTEEHLYEFSKVWNNTRGTQPHPVTLLSSLIDTEEEAINLGFLWKFSNFEKDLITFIVSNRYLPTLEDKPLKPYQDMIIKLSTAKAVDITRKKVLELLNYEGKRDESEEIRKWVVPVFPIRGSDLKEAGIKPGPEFGKLLSKLRDVWIDSYYTTPREFLIHEIESFCNKSDKNI